MKRLPKRWSAAIKRSRKKIENGAVSGFTKISDAFVDQYLTKDGESVKEAKARLAAEQAEREAKRDALHAAHHEPHIGGPEKR